MRLFRAFALTVLAALPLAACGAEPAVAIPVPQTDAVKTPGPLKIAVLAGGCFWGVQGVYQHLQGVRNVVSGYAGGDSARTDYEAVSGGDTGHAESVQIVYDPAQVTYGEILRVFFSVAHDPTQLNRQGPDSGTQYRSAIFFADAEQKKIAQSYIAQLDAAKVFGQRIVTRVDPLRKFHAAEAYHQDYLLNHPDQPYIVYNDLPKVRNFARMLPELYAATPVTVAGAKKLPAAASAPATGTAMMSAKPAEHAPAEHNEGGAMMMSAKPAAAATGQGDLAALAAATGWQNSAPLTKEKLRGKVVVIDFWTYSCINCLRALPYINAWYHQYQDAGLVVIGVHSPEFGFEKDSENVRRAIKQFGIQYPVALDSNMAIWNAFNNRFWPAHYFIDAEGNLRDHHFGEGKYERSERIIRKLLTEAGAKNLPDPVDSAAGSGISAAADTGNVGSPETYVGFERAQNFVSPGSFAHDKPRDYQRPATLKLNEWALVGNWRVGAEMAHGETAGGRISFRFRARDLHLVLGPDKSGKPVRFRVMLDGKPPAASHGTDTDAAGAGTVKEQRLYQLIRQSGDVAEHEFTIEFLDSNVEAYAFTFG